MGASLMVEMGHLFPELCREHYERSRNQFERLGLGRGQPAVLKALWQTDGMTLTELSRALHVQPATITRLVQRMEQAHWVARCPDPADQRVVRVYQTQAAREIRAQVEGLLETVSSEMVHGFAVEEQLLFRRFLIQARDNLRRLNDA
jgi:DNA-binding MarR family transcriptional regulator